MKRLKNLSLSTHWIIPLIFLMVGAVVGLLSSQFSADINIGTLGAFILIIISFVWQIVFLKCPHCGYHFHLRRPVTLHCPNCGEKIS